MEIILSDNVVATLRLTFNTWAILFDAGRNMRLLRQHASMQERFSHFEQILNDLAAKHSRVLEASWIARGAQAQQRAHAIAVATPRLAFAEWSTIKTSRSMQRKNSSSLDVAPASLSDWFL